MLAGLRAGCRVRLAAESLQHLVRTPVADASALLVHFGDAAGRVTANAHEPARYLAALHVVEHGERMRRVERWSFLAVRQEEQRRGITRGLGNAHRPEHAFGDFAGIAPAHAALDVVER